MSPSGSLLENYKQWYSSQPKLLRVAILPGVVAILGAVLQVLPDISNSVRLWGGLLLCLLLAVSAYNQFIDTGIQDELHNEIKRLASSISFKDGEIQELEELQDFWDRRIEDYVQLDNIYSELVLFKSKMWLEAIAISKDDSLSAGRGFIRKKNTLKENVDRIIASMYKFFDRYSRAAANRHFRVAYFTPNADNSCLELASWSSFHQTAPKINGNCRTAFEKGGASLAAFVWTRSTSPFAFIHDTYEYLSNNPESSVFARLNGSDASHIGAIVAYRIEDGLTNACLGVLCIDCNQPNVFEDEIGEDTCRQIISSFATRIVFENRFSSMKSCLGPYPQEASQ